MASGKSSKNNPSSREGAVKVNLVLSDSCEKCDNKCEKGKKYLAKINSGRGGIGVVCKK